MTVYVTGDVHGRAEYGSSRFTETVVKPLDLSMGI